MSRSRASSVDSLFDDVHDDAGPEADGSPNLFQALAPAASVAPPVLGLLVFPGLLPAAVANDALAAIAEADHFVGGARDQVMLFTRAPGPPDAPSASAATPAAVGLPAHVASLIDAVRAALEPHVDDAATRATLFAQPLARQVILNLYAPGQGIAPHVDLPHRYADGIVGVCLAGACVMRFTQVGDGPAAGGGEQPGGPPSGGGGGVSELGVAGADVHDVYLPPRTVYAMTGDARWRWAHGIAARTEDLVRRPDGRVDTVVRGTRVSVTMRWMQPGADVLS